MQRGFFSPFSSPFLLPHSDFWNIPCLFLPQLKKKRTKKRRLPVRAGISSNRMRLDLTAGVAETQREDEAPADKTEVRAAAPFHCQSQSRSHHLCSHIKCRSVRGTHSSPSPPSSVPPPPLSFLFIHLLILISSNLTRGSRRLRPPGRRRSGSPPPLPPPPAVVLPPLPLSPPPPPPAAAH